MIVARRIRGGLFFSSAAVACRGELFVVSVYSFNRIACQAVVYWGTTTAGLLPRLFIIVF